MSYLINLIVRLIKAESYHGLATQTRSRSLIFCVVCLICGFQKKNKQEISNRFDRNEEQIKDPYGKQQ